MVDATATTLKRMKEGKRWYAAHREFSYQLACKGRNHGRVVMKVLLVNIVVSPLVIFAAYDPRFVLPVFAVVLTIWTLVWHRVQAGDKS